MEPRAISSRSRTGGKLRKPTPQKSKPYDLPPPPLATKSKGWFSKLIGGATTIIPFIFSAVSSLYSDDEDDEDDHGNTDYDMKASQPQMDDGRCNSSKDVIVSSKEAHPNEVPESSKRFSKLGELGKGKQILSSYKSDISSIEQFIKGRTFSRDEFNHLIEILNSKTSDSHEAEPGTREIVTVAAVETERPLWTRQGRPEDYNRAILETPIPQRKVGDKIGASPIDLATSFTKRRKLEPCATPYRVSVKDEERLQLIESATKPLMPSPSRASPMSSPHWPGIMVADQRGYASPLTHKGRHGIHDFSRTPYSRTLYSNSRAKPPVDSRYPSSQSNFFQKSRIPIYGQAKTRYDTLQDLQGSVGPIRRLRGKSILESRSRGSVFSTPLVEVHSPEVIPVKRSLESNDTNNNSDPLPVDTVPSGLKDSISFLTPSTSQAVRRILEHLDRTKPTPKEKAAEIERATSWRKPSASLRFDKMGKAIGNLSYVNKVDLVSKGDNVNATSNVQIKSPMVADMRNPGSKQFSSPFESISGSASQSLPEQANNGMSGRLLKETSKSQIDNGIYAPNHSFELPKWPVAEVTSSKPILSSISISKPDPRRMMSSENGVGFTFPVSASFGVMSEPPTPSVMPSSSATVASSPQTPVSTVPCYSFGSKITSPPLAFSFPGVNIASSDVVSDLKFGFGSDKSSRLSFKSVGKGPI